MSLMRLCYLVVAVFTVFLLLIIPTYQKSQYSGGTWTGYGINPLRNSSKIGVDIAISSVSVLLPKHQDVYFPIESYNGCFKWSLSNPDMVDLIVLDKECGCRILIKSSVGPRDNFAIRDAYDDDKRLKCWLLAEDLNTSRILRTEVFLDDIHYLKIFTTTRNLYKDDTQVLQVQAFDSRDNVFSSVDGLEFKWTIISENGDESSSILAFQTFKDQHLEVSDNVLEIERQGKKSGVVLVKALAAGRVKIITSLTSPIFSNVPSTFVSINVFEPLRLEPQEHIFLPPLSTFQLALQTLDKGLFKNVSLPNSNYIWSSSNSSIVEIADTGILFTGELFGSATVFVRVASIKENHVKSVVSVVEPSTINLEISSHLNPNTKLSKYIIKDQLYWVQIFIYDSFGNKIQATSSIDFQISIDNRHFLRMDNDSHSFNDKILLSPIRIGISQFNATISNHQISSNRLTISKKLTIIDPISVFPNIGNLLIPYHPDIKHTFKFVALGGTESYTWNSDNYLVATINNNGLLTPWTPGKGKVICTDYHEPSNVATINFTITNPVDLAITKGPRGTAVGSYLILGVSLFATPISQLDVDSGIVPEHLSFDNCSLFSFSWEIKSPDIFSKPDHTSCESLNTTKTCSCIKLLALKEGRTKITVSYLFNDTLIEKSVFIQSLNKVDVVPSKLMLTLGASSKFTVTSSSQKHLYKKPIDPFIKPQFPNSISIESLNSVNGHWEYSITCLSYGDQEVFISIDDGYQINQIVHSDFFKTKLSFSCKPPTYSLVSSTALPEDGPSVHCLNPLLKRHLQNAHLPLEILSSKYEYKVRFGVSINFFLLLLDENGRIFDSYNPLQITWNNSNPSSLSFNTTTDRNITDCNKNSLQFPCGSLSDYPWTKFILFAHKNYGSATIDLTVTLPPINTSKIHDVGLTSTSPSSDNLQIHSSFNIVFSPNLELEPSILYIYHHPKNYKMIGIRGGTGNVEIFVNQTQIINFGLNQNKLIIKPLTLGTVELLVMDSCLICGTNAKSLITISEIHSIGIRGNEILQLGEQAILHVDVFDSNGNRFNVDQYEFMNIHLHFDGDILDLNPGFQSNSFERIDSNVDLVHSFSLKLLKDNFTVLGTSLGFTTISVSIANFYSRRMVFSNPIQIHVYAPLHVKPSLLELLPDTFFQLHVVGGPSFNTNYKFSIENETLASISPDGIISTYDLVGNTSIFITVIFNNELVIARQSISLVVKMLKEIAIYSPIDRFLCGESLIAFVVGRDGESPFIWNGLDLSFKWSVLNPDVIALSQNDNDQFSIEITALSPGITQINVRVVSGPPYLIGKFASFKFTVIPLLFTEFDNVRPFQLLMTPNSMYHLKFYTGAITIDILNSHELIVAWDASNSNIVSNGIIGHSFIYVTNTAHSQSSVFQIDVEPFHHIQLVPRNENSTARAIMVGDWVDYKLVLKNHIGKPFDSFNNDLSLEWLTSKQNIVLIQILESKNDSQLVLRINGLKAGHAILKIQAVNLQKNMRANFFLHLNVLNSIQPMNPVVHVGGNINFHTSFPIESNKKIWYTLSKELIEIDPLSGVATAFKPGITKICYNSSVYTETHVKISNVDHILAHRSCDILTNLKDYQGACHECILKITFFDEKGNEFLDNADIKQNLNMLCKFHDDTSQQLFAIQTIEDERKCVLKLKNVSNNHVSSILNSVVVWVYTGWNEYSVEHAVNIPFIPAFSIITGKNVILSSRNSSSDVLILSSNPLQIRIEEKSKIEIKLRKIHSENHTYVYQIRIIDFSTPFDSLPVRFFDPETRQSEDVFVFFGRIINKPTEFGNIVLGDVESHSNLSSFFISVLIVSLTILVAYFISILRNNEIQYKPSTSSSGGILSSPFMRTQRVSNKSI